MKRLFFVGLLAACSSTPHEELHHPGVPAPIVTGSPSASPQTPGEGKPGRRGEHASASSAEVDRANDFSAKLLVAAGQGKAQNLAVSGTSVRLALALVAQGAKGQTAEEMVSALQLDPKDAAKAAKGELADWSHENSKGISLAIANRIFADDATPPLASFLTPARDDFGADLENLPFAKSPESARASVNAWVKKATKDRIPVLMPEGSVTGDTRLVVANAVHFLGQWTTPFDVKMTADLPFSIDGKSEAKVPTMRRFAAPGPYAEDGDVKLASLPYGDGRMEMVIVLPNEKDGLSAVLGRLDGEQLRAWKTALGQHGADLNWSLPKFELNWGDNLTGVLEKLGMQRVFTSGADLSGMAQGRLAVSGVFHKTYVRVDEKGTEAAAATGVGMVATSVPPPPTPFVVDHPFLYYLVDHVSGRVLFIGTVVDPRGK